MREAAPAGAPAPAGRRAAIAPGVSTADLDALAEAVVREAGAVPSFKGYHGFPATICSSVNEQIVHAIPASTQVLREGDVISIDCGAILDGWHGDAAVTVGVGQIDPKVERMITVAEDAMWAGIAAGARALRTGRGRLTDISAAIEASIRGAGRYGIVRGYGGHGIGTERHPDPPTLNYGRPGAGPRPRPRPGPAVEPRRPPGPPDTLQLAPGRTGITPPRPPPRP